MTYFKPDSRISQRLYNQDHERQEVIEHQRRQRLYRSILQKHKQRIEAGQARQENEKQWRLDSLTAIRDRLREQLQGIDECYQAEARYQQDQIEAFKRTGYDFDVSLHSEELERLQVQHDQEATELQSHLDMIESELQGFNSTGNHD
jgi:hypothetical protein